MKEGRGKKEEEVKWRDQEMGKWENGVRIEKGGICKEEKENRNRAWGQDRGEEGVGERGNCHSVKGGRREMRGV